MGRISLFYAYGFFIKSLMQLLLPYLGEEFASISYWHEQLWHLKAFHIIKFSLILLDFLCRPHFLQIPVDGKKSHIASVNFPF